MRRAVLMLVSAAGLAVATACPTTDPPARFPHIEHLVELECGNHGRRDCLQCGSCHSTAKTDGEILPPQSRQCSTCHEHPRQVLAQSRPRAPRPGEAVRFSHGDHLKRQGIDGQCVQCHAGVVSDDPRAPVGPRMDTCLDCHRADFDQARCSVCHRKADLVVLEPISFMRHDARWISRHGLAATQSRQICQTLRLQDKAPEAIFREMPHRADFITQHAVAVGNQAACMSCHSPSSCDSCHVARGVSAAAVGARSPHPQGWLGSDTSSRNFHGRAARRNLLQCAGCHDHGPQTNCIHCHRPGGPGGNPHPNDRDGWQSQSAPMCRYCHE